MSTEWSINYKGNELVLKDGFLIAYQLLLFEEIEWNYGSSDNELNEFKIILLNDTATIYAGWWGGIDFTSLSEATINKLIQLTDSIIQKARNSMNYLTASHIYRSCKEAHDYLISSGKSDWIFEFDSAELIYGDEQLPIENYSHAFHLIKLLMMGTLKHSDINGLLVG
ncbi:hypothetical protein GCM10007422_12960 [Pedobacter zeae]|nr:hypothetical protein GCM10007422_12960 [Pedobacter zeae]